MLLTVTDLAELWMVLHEFGHTLMELPGAAKLNEFFGSIDQFARSCVRTLGQVPLVQEKWRLEHQADLCAAVTLTTSVAVGPLVEHDPEGDRLHNATWLSLGGISAAMETLNYVEAAYRERPGFSFRKHPPAYRRWDAVRQYAVGCMPPQHEESVQTLANLIAALSSEMMGAVFN
jgi:hypothetical protein